MFAIIETGSKQYKVAEGDELLIELLEGAVEAKTVKLDRVLLVSKGDDIAIGTPHLAGAYCEADVLGHVKAPKVISFKYIRREKSSTIRGHRQQYLKVKIKSIHSGKK